MGGGVPDGVWNAVPAVTSLSVLVTLRCESEDGCGSMKGRRRCGGASGGTSSPPRSELALLCAVPGLRPLGDGSLRGDGKPFGLRCSGGGIAGAALSNGCSSRDRCDR